MRRRNHLNGKKKAAEVGKGDTPTPAYKNTINPYYYYTTKPPDGSTLFLENPCKSAKIRCFFRIFSPIFRFFHLINPHGAGVFGQYKA